MHTPDGKAPGAASFGSPTTPPTITAPSQPHASTSGQTTRAHACPTSRQDTASLPPCYRVTFQTHTAAGARAHVIFAHAPIRIDTRAGNLETHSGRRFALAPGAILATDADQPEPSRLTLAVRALARLTQLER